jgi:hypothetical protein
MALGIKTGGRRKGTPNRVTAAVTAAVAADGTTPLEFLLCVMRDEMQPTELRLEAAARAAPYCHPRLSAIAVRAQVDDQRDVETRRALIDQLMGFIDKKPVGHIEGHVAAVEVSPSHRIA